MSRDEQRNVICRELRRLGVRPWRGRGQNFIADESVIVQVLEFARISPEDDVLEIGPGLGVMSLRLAPLCERYIGVEVEERFCQHLRARLRSYPCATVLCSDIRQCALQKIALGERRLLVLGNVPYSISSDVVNWLIENRQYVARASLMLQREFAERVAAEPGQSQYGALSVFCSVYAQPRLGPVIKGSSFYPEAKVESRLVELKMRDQAAVEMVNESQFFSLVRAAFSSRRKTLANSLAQSSLFDNKDDVIALLSCAGVDPCRRPQTLSAQEFSRIAALAPLGKGSAR